MMEQELYFSTGDAARELGVIQDQIVALCKADAIEAELTPGGHWRIGEAVLNKLKERGSRRSLDPGLAATVPPTAAGRRLRSPKVWRGPLLTGWSAEELVECVDAYGRASWFQQGQR
jgi:hypothetical protein